MKSKSSFRSRCVLKPGLQRKRLALVFNHTTEEWVVVREGHVGYYEIKKQPAAREAQELNRKMGVSPEMARAMITGAMFGWHVPGCKPEKYLWNVEEEKHGHEEAEGES